MRNGTLKYPNYYCVFVFQSVHTFTRLWYHIDCRGQVVGRLAVQVALLLIGKTKPIYHPAGTVYVHKTL